MSLAGQLYKLQQLDLELQKKQQELSEVENQLGDNKALVAAESRLASQKQQLEDARKKQKNSEWELEDLQERIRQIDGKLYSGKTKDPKELVNLEKEVKGLKSQTTTKEDTLLGLMSLVEEMEARAKTTAAELERLKKEWEERQETLRPRKGEIEIALAELKVERSRLAEQIDSEAFNIYERIRLTRGQAVVKVEKGRCLGCHITVPTSQWQKAKAGELIQCNNCSRILYLE
ncbi:MAG: C4-type zinc ribbon domain-containing protein [Dehalococcoidia bacterium]|nr:C4-type zinc ribbon domain-containing protein [Dehalococcoidia bacterium]MDH4291087.1 C4-type zinc ribbon domain-containing protein [Dehalococcoidia bacterium]